MPICAGIHGFDSYVLADDNGEPMPVYSIACGLDYPGIGPEHAYLRDTGMVKHEAISDEEAMEAFFLLSRCEGIIPAVESAQLHMQSNMQRSIKAARFSLAFRAEEIRILTLFMQSTAAVRNLLKNTKKTAENGYELKGR